MKNFTIVSIIVTLCSANLLLADAISFLIAEEYQFTESYFASVSSSFVTWFSLGAVFIACAYAFRMALVGKAKYQIMAEEGRTIDWYIKKFVFQNLSRVKFTNPTHRITYRLMR